MEPVADTGPAADPFALAAAPVWTWYVGSAVHRLAGCGHDARPRTSTRLSLRTTPPCPRCMDAVAEAMRIWDTYSPGTPGQLVFATGGGVQWLLLRRALRSSGPWLHIPEGPNSGMLAVIDSRGVRIGRCLDMLTPGTFVVGPVVAASDATSALTAAAQLLDPAVAAGAEGISAALAAAVSTLR